MKTHVFPHFTLSSSQNAATFPVFHGNYDRITGASTKVSSCRALFLGRPWIPNFIILARNQHEELAKKISKFSSAARAENVLRKNTSNMRIHIAGELLPKKTSGQNFVHSRDAVRMALNIWSGSTNVLNELTVACYAMRPHGEHCYVGSLSRLRKSLYSLSLIELSSCFSQSNFCWKFPRYEIFAWNFLSRELSISSYKLL